MKSQGKSGNFCMTLNNKNVRYVFVAHSSQCWVFFSISLVQLCFNITLCIKSAVFCSQVPFCFIRKITCTKTTLQFAKIRSFIQFVFGKSNLFQVVYIHFLLLFLWNLFLTSSFSVYFNFFCYRTVIVCYNCKQNSRSLSKVIDSLSLLIILMFSLVCRICSR